jgi:hypothetical protein
MFESVLVLKRAGRVASGLDDMVISLFAHGMSVRAVMHHLVPPKAVTAALYRPQTPIMGGRVDDAVPGGVYTGEPDG